MRLAAFRVRDVNEQARIALRFIRAALATLATSYVLSKPLAHHLLALGPELLGTVWIDGVGADAAPDAGADIGVFCEFRHMAVLAVAAAYIIGGGDDAAPHRGRRALRNGFKTIRRPSRWDGRNIGTAKNTEGAIGFAYAAFCTCSDDGKFRIAGVSFRSVSFAALSVAPGLFKKMFTNAISAEVSF
jgi:hypothetical protein